MVQSYSPGGGNVSYHEGTLAYLATMCPPSGHIGATWQIRLNLCILGLLESTTQMANWSVQPFLHTSRQKVPIIYNGRPHPPELPLPMGGSEPPSNTGCLGTMRAHNPSGISIGSVVFAQMTAECPYTLQWFAHFSLKIAPSHGRIWTSCNTWFLGTTRVLNPNDNSITSAVFVELTNVTECQTDTQTDGPRYSVGNNSLIGRMYVRNTTMRRNNA